MHAPATIPPHAPGACATIVDIYSGQADRAEVIDFHGCAVSPRLAEQLRAG